MARKTTAEKKAALASINAMSDVDLATIYRDARAKCIEIISMEDFINFVLKHKSFKFQQEKCDMPYLKANLQRKFFAEGEQSPGFVTMVERALVYEDAQEKVDATLVEFANREFDQLPEPYKVQLTEEGKKTTRTGKQWWENTRASLRHVVTNNAATRETRRKLAASASICGGAWRPDGGKIKSIFSIQKTPNTDAVPSIQSILAMISKEQTSST